MTSAYIASYFPTPIRTITLFARNILIETISLIVYGLLSKYCEWRYPVSDSPLHCARNGTDSLPPIIIIHGLGAHPSHMVWLAKNLSYDGKIYVYDERLTSSKTSLEASKTALEAIKTLTTGQFYLIGHSRGGNICAAILEQDPECVAALFTMSTPHRGSRTNYFASLPTRTHHAYESPELEGRLTAMQAHANKCFFIAARWDVITLPGIDSAIPCSADQSMIYNWGGHLAPPFSIQAASFISTHLY